MTLFPFQAASANVQVGMVLGVLIGFGFGFVLERAGFGNARKLAGQFYGTEMVMLKVMFTAIVTAVLGTVVVSGVGLLDLRALGDSVASGTFLWPMLAGGFLIGIGIIFSGYCPGTSLVGIASGKLDALLAYAGVVLGQVIWSEVEFRPAVASFHNSGDLGHLYLYDLLRLPPAVVAAAIVAMALGAFLLGEKIERVLTGAQPPAGETPRRFVFGGMVGIGLLGLVTLALPHGTLAGAAAPDRITAAELARRVVDEPWKVRVLDLRPLEACAAQRVPGAECAPAASLAALSLGDVSPARALVVVSGGAGSLPPELSAYRGEVLVLEGGFPAWQAYALAAPQPPAPGAGPSQQEDYRVRAGLSAALTGVKQAAPPPVPTGGGPAVKHKAGGGGCSG